MDLLDEPVAEGYRTTVAVWGGYDVDICLHLFDCYGIHLTPTAHPEGYAHAWCYGSYESALLAVKRWDPDTEAEPTKFVARYTNQRVRKAGDRAPQEPQKAQEPPGVDQATPLV